MSVLKKDGTEVVALKTNFKGTETGEEINVS